jgi:uncharacterized protein YyaL (SSP411 family)
MAGRLAASVSPYLRSHADNPVDWWRWGDEPFAEARRRDVPVLVSIGYATCHWCHVMARESFSDPELAEYLNANFVAIKVDREEHPDVDAAFIAAASAFTRHLGWPLTMFTTPGGAPIFGGTYFPPRPVQGMPSFRQVLEAVNAAWTDRRDDMLATGRILVEAISQRPGGDDVALPQEAQLAAASAALETLEDPEFGGFGTDTKFPTAPAVAFLFEREGAGDAAAGAFARRMMTTMAASPLRDAIEGGFFRYAVQRDWSEPHYERMLSDNAQLLDLATDLATDLDGEASDEARALAEGLASFLLDVLRLPSGAFASAQDSESLIDGVRSEGGYYALDTEERARQPRPALDAKVLTGLNGMAIGALATAGVRFDRSDWIDAARQAAEAVLRLHADAAVDGTRLARASLGDEVSDAVATLEDYGGLAGGLVRLGLATGEPGYLARARALVEACAAPEGAIAAPAGADPVLAAHGLMVEADSGEGATPSGRSLLADAALRLAALTGDDAHRAIAEAAVRPLLAPAILNPIGFGAALVIAQRLASPLEQLVVVTADVDGGVVPAARAWARPSRTLAIVTEAQAAALAASGLELFSGRSARDAAATAYFCEHFVCALPVTTGPELDALLASGRHQR